MKLLIVSGGGGHFSPALAVIQTMPEDWEVTVVGRQYAFEGDTALSFEYQTAKKLGINFRVLETGRLQRKFTRHTLSSLMRVPVGFAQAMSILKEEKPDVVLSFGGYVSVPIGFAAHTLGIPIVLHEQILSAGLSNKLIARFAKKICISWKESENHLPKAKCVLTGNPLRKFPMATMMHHPLKTSPQPSPNRRGGQMEEEGSSGVEDLPLLYVTGGSGGSHALNSLVEGALENLLEKYCVVHQTGDAKEFGDFARLEQLREGLPEPLKNRYFLYKFVEPAKMFEFLMWANLIVSRSGINTVTELIYMGKPCLLIPLPYGQHDEQLENAKFVQKIGLGEVAEQEGLTSDALFEKIEAMMNDIEKYKAHAQEAKKLVDPHATEKVIEVVKEVVRVES